MCVVSLLSNGRIKREAEKELSSHIDDRTDYYIELGFSEEEAEEKAVNQMGSAKDTAEKLSKVHPQRRIVTGILITVLLIIFTAVNVLFSMFNTMDDGTHGVGISELFLLIGTIGLARLGKKRESIIISLISVLHFFTCYGFLVMCISDGNFGFHSVCSPMLFTFFCIVTADFKALSAFSSLPGVTVAPYLTYTTVILYSLFFVLVILSAVNVYRLNHPSYSFSSKKLSSIISNAFKGIFAFSLVMSSITFIIFLTSPSFTVSGIELLQAEDNIVIIQSNSPIPLDAFEEGNEQIVSFNYDWSIYPDSLNNYFYYENDFVELNKTNRIEKIKIGNKLTYLENHYTVDIYPKKDYVFIGFSSDYDALTNPEQTISPDIKGEWYKADETCLITKAVKEYALIDITVNNKASA